MKISTTLDVWKPKLLELNRYYIYTSVIAVIYSFQVESLVLYDKSVASLILSFAIHYYLDTNKLFHSIFAETILIISLKNFSDELTNNATIFFAFEYFVFILLLVRAALVIYYLKKKNK